MMLDPYIYMWFNLELVSLHSLVKVPSLRLPLYKFSADGGILKVLFQLSVYSV